MEAYEAFVALALETEGFVVSGPVKFSVTRQTEKSKHREIQTHGYEVDLVAARADQLVLASVKSFFGSRGVVADHVTGDTPNRRFRNAYKLLNDPFVREAVLSEACARYGYNPTQVYLRLYVGRFAAPSKGLQESNIREWCGATVVGGGPIEVFGVHSVVERVRKAAADKQYRDHPSLVTLKALEAAGLLTLGKSDKSFQE